MLVLEHPDDAVELRPPRRRGAHRLVTPREPGSGAEWPLSEQLEYFLAHMGDQHDDGTGDPGLVVDRVVGESQ